MNYEQVAQSMNDVLHFCVDINNSTWFGGPETQYQYWPLNKFNWTDKSYVTKELDSQAVSAKLLIFFKIFLVSTYFTL